MLITNEPFQTLEYKEYEGGFGDKTAGIVEKNKIDGEWITKTILMNRTHALKLAVEIFKTYKRE